MEINIRSAKISDSVAIAELSKQLGYETEVVAVQHRLEKILKHSENCIYTATTKEGEVVGWIHGFYALRVEANFFVEIGGLVVNTNFRKNGIGQKLVDKVIEWSRSKNYTKLRVRCNAIRKESHKFYEKIGFELNKEQKVFDIKLPE